MIETVIVDSDKTSRDLIKNYLEKVDDISVKEEYENINQAYTDIIESRPNLAIIDISNKTQDTLEYIVKISNHLKNTKIVVLSYNMDSEIIIQALRSGAREFLVKPLIEKDFIEAVKKLKDLITGNADEEGKCKVISVFSNKGGIGKTSIATNVALEIANTTKEKVALIDLNMQIGDITTFLDLNPVFNTSYVINNLDRIDEAFLLSSLEKYKNTGLYVLADPPDMEQAESITGDNVAKLISVLRNVFSYIIIDTTSGFNETSISALDASDLILLVSIVNLPAIRNCQRCFDLFSKLGYPKDKVKLVINRYLENDEIKIEDVERVLSHSVYFKIPNNYFTIINAINKGLSVNEVNQSSNIAKSFRELANLLSDNFMYEKNLKPTKRDDNFSLLNLFKKEK